MNPPWFPKPNERIYWAWDGERSWQQDWPFTLVQLSSFTMNRKMMKDLMTNIFAPSPMYEWLTKGGE